MSALFLMAILSANSGADINARGLLLLGDASYACYLLHTILIEILRHQGVATSGTFLFATGVLLASWCLAILWHLTVEKVVLQLRFNGLKVILPRI